MKNNPRVGRSKIRNGLLFGAIIAVVYILTAFIEDMTGTTVALITIGSGFRPVSLLNQVDLLVAAVLFFVAGSRTARVENKLSSAALAGLIAACIVMVVEIATAIVNQDFLYSSTIATLAQEKRLIIGGFQSLLFDPFSGTNLTLIIYSAVGAGFGFLGGIVDGQRRQEALWR